MKAKLFYLFMLSSLAGCTIDNYEMPHLTLSGKILDAQTNELIPSSGANAGALVKLYEGNSTQPLLYTVKPDGTFQNSRVFPATYKIVAEGAFDRVEDTITETISKDMQLDIKVTPHVRLQLTLAGITDTTAEIKMHYKKINADQEIVKLGVVWSTFAYPNATVFPEGDIILEDAAPALPAEGDRTYTVSGLKAGATYYIRALALTNNAGGYYNYSTQLEAEAK
ncbi:DUF3823 domain-containing protein [Compostibacter hankyongensis]|uniref:DUF3823 domain-containing protein n=1 Tax=Compostibacter hankyongensis TaxID=1007089 RepID=A0ABP8FEQ9_9BACT